MAEPNSPSPDRSLDVLRSQARPLDALLRPRTVAVIGATERAGSVGRSVLTNLTRGPYQGKVVAVNPKHRTVLGVPCFPSITALPQVPDLAVVVTPAASVPGIVKECATQGLGGAIILSAGFKELGAPGRALEEEVLKSRGPSLRLLGPNCLGVINPHLGLNATFASQQVEPGSVAFLSQSGALGTAILEWSRQSGVGFSSFVSTGSMLDVGWGDLIDDLGNDPHTRTILVYMESIGDAPAFLSAAREVAYSKPILVLKAGRTEAAAKAAVSHTGSLVGSHGALEAAFRRAGVLLVESIEDLFNMAEVLAKQPRPQGRRLSIVTNAGGPGVLAVDALVVGGGEVADLSDKVRGELDAFLPPHWSRANPVDVLGDATPERFVKALDLCLWDKGCDGLLAILTPQDMTDPARAVELLKERATGSGKPLLACLMGGREMETLRGELNRSGVPSFAFPETAARSFNYMWAYQANLQSLYETPSWTGEGPDQTRREEVARTLAGVLQEGRTLLTEFESKQVLSRYGLPMVETRLAKDVGEALKAAGEMGFPLVLKLHSRTITHKSDVGGVRLDLKDAEAVSKAFRGIRDSVEKKAGPGNFQGVTVQRMVSLEGVELVLGVAPDPQFGPVLLFGAGGKWVEVQKDTALALPPLTNTLARQWMERTRVHRALLGARGVPPADLDRLEGLLVAFSRLVLEQPLLKEADLNPLLVAGSEMQVLDARLLLRSPGEAPGKPVIRPYPNEYVKGFTLKDATPVTIRPIRPEDEKAMVDFHKALSEQSVYLRYFQPMTLDQRTAHQRLIRICFIDYRREMALVAELQKPSEGQQVILGVGRLSPSLEDGCMEFSLLIRDSWQGKGLGTELLSRLVGIGRKEGVRRIRGFILPENQAMQGAARKLGFQVAYSPDHQCMMAVLETDPPTP